MVDDGRLNRYQQEQNENIARLSHRSPVSSSGIWPSGDMITKTSSNFEKSTDGMTSACWNKAISCFSTRWIRPINIPLGKLPANPEVNTGSPTCNSESGGRYLILA